MDPLELEPGHFRYVRLLPSPFSYRRIVPPLGLEPRTYWLKASYSDQLSYGGVFLKYTTLRDVCQVDLNGIEPMTS